MKSGGFMNHKAYLQKLRDNNNPGDLPFSIEEYQKRIKDVKRAMEQAQLEVLLIAEPANLYYLTGFYTFAVYEACTLILPLQGTPAIHVYPTEIPAAWLTWVDEIYPFNWNEMNDIGFQLANILKEKALEGTKIGLEFTRGGYIPKTVEQLKKYLPGNTFCDASELVSKIRLIKSPQEIEYLRKAGQITAKGVNASLAAIRSGITDTQVAKAGHEAMLGAGSDFFCMDPIVNSGHRSSWHHATHRRVMLQQGDNVYMEYGGCYQRYTSPMMRTAVIGNPSKHVLQMTEAVKNTLNLVIQGAKPGRTCHDVAMAVKPSYQKLMSEMWFMGVCGYSVGAGFPPTWADHITVIAEGVEEVLQPGMTFHLPIMFRVPGQFGVGLSETIAITEQGCEILTEPNRDLYIVDI
jgi:Xaa-Pro dipeptidase